MTRDLVRLIIPDSHGDRIDPLAQAACLADARRIQPDEIIMLGDHVDCSAMFNAHGRSYVKELEESYEADCDAANVFLDALQACCKSIDYIEGNHEFRVERWAAKVFTNPRDAAAYLESQAPDAKLRLKERGIKFYRTSRFYDGLSIPGTIRRGKCFFTHGILASKFATYQHLLRFGANVVHGHTHRSQAFVARTVTSDCLGAWSPGTLAKLQPTYMHTNPTDWSHGYGLQFVAPRGAFLHVNVPIYRGTSMLSKALSIGKRAA